ncbi:MAG: hydantoinase B/oxoprolinase family protein [Proteobacteria bacterium]|nr:hydantoinase B/oxoprolinase family protein [Pseudomonadota bacterium]
MNPVHSKSAQAAHGYDPVTLQVIKDSLTAIGQEMFQVMIRTSMSPIIYETTDFAVGLTDAHGELVAQGNGVAGFLATLDTAVQSTLQHHPADTLKSGDVIITNTPYEGGGTHLSDVVIIVPILVGNELVGFSVNKSHWTEIGGKDAGSVTTTATEIFQEGLHLRFVKLYEEGRLNRSLVDVIAANVRMPDQTIGDMHAGVAAARTGERRVQQLFERYGMETVSFAMADLMDYGERLTRAQLRALPVGTYEAEDVIEEDGAGNGPFKLKVKVTLRDGNMLADFTGTDPQAHGPINSSRTALGTAVRCALKAITDPDLPANGGCFRPIEIICPDGTLVSAQSPAPVSIYYESLVAVIELVWKALAPAMLERLPAGHYRSVGGTFLAGTHPDSRQFFVLGEPLLGGWGATHQRDGLNGMFCCANGETYNIPVELAESRYGVQIEQYAFHQEAGGAGQYRGGRGVVLDYRVTSDEAFLTVTYSRTSTHPWGLNGGGEGSSNRAEIHRQGGALEVRTMATGVPVQQGDLIRIFTGHGGGYGDPRARGRDAIQRDLRDGYITPEQAREDYGFAQ